MPVAGLPTALKIALGDLLHEKAVLFWVSSAEGRKTIIVLRLVTTDSKLAGFAHPHTAAEHFRRKPPRLVQRDQLQAGEPTRHNPDESEHSPGLFQPAPPPETTVTAQLEMQCEGETRHI